MVTKIVFACGSEVFTIILGVSSERVCFRKVVESKWYGTKVIQQTQVMCIRLRINRASWT